MAQILPIYVVDLTDTFVDRPALREGLTFQAEILFTVDFCGEPSAIARDPFGKYYFSDVPNHRIIT